MNAKTYRKANEIADMIGQARENMQTMIELNALGFRMLDMIERQERRINQLKEWQMTMVTWEY